MLCVLSCLKKKAESYLSMSVKARAENKKQLHYYISAIRNRISISLNIINKHDHNQQAFASNNKSIHKHFVSQYIAQYEIRSNDYFRLKTLKLMINNAIRK